MAYFALLNNSSVVEVVIYVDNINCLNEDGVESESVGITYCHNLSPGRWIKTSYNASIRKNYAGINYIYDESRDAFISPQPYESWLLNEDTCQWGAPVLKPSEGFWEWNEETISWVSMSVPELPTE